MSLRASAPPTFGQAEMIRVILIEEVVELILMFFYGMQVVLFFYSMAASVKKGISTRNQKILLCTYALTFVLATFREITGLVPFPRYINLLFLQYDSSPPADGPLPSWDALEKLGNISTVSCFVEIFLNDGLLIWRAYSLLQSKKWILILPCLMSITSFIMFLGILTHFPGYLFLVAQILSFGANVVITSLIGHVYWVHRKYMKVLFHEANHQSKVGSILSILVTTGVILSVARMIYIIIDFYPDPSSYAFSALKSIYFGFEFIHPTLTIVLLNIERDLQQHSIIKSLFLPIHSSKNDEKSAASTQNRPWESIFAVPIGKSDSGGDSEGS
ncbi:hypothetical protein BDZ94DRAFT_1311683 [Collybia nuda]|uniref:Uncharacterized protein n=1 Tax=Collybia nuda TaxID=64659 RepID=A0A9P5Y019_9AGAR|nr:hypothetical protein BDZ94DRAFT_1311683 [Collybia nuda]